LKQSTLATGFAVNRIEIIFERCKGCYLCVDACPKHLIEQGTDLNASGYYPARPTTENTCTACAICATVCPDVAIEVFKDAEPAAAAKAASAPEAQPEKVKSRG
jgi:2-oxoglutarate ferredoxin oxidoreductase subunit delta